MDNMISLCGEWEMCSTRDMQWHPATVPGSVYADLMDAQLLDDPFFRDNEQKAYEKIREDFLYRRTFFLDEKVLRARELRLVFEGLDTLCEISVNDQFVLSTSDMHRTYMVDIRPMVHAGGNLLTILFRSPVEAAHAAYRRSPVNGSTDAVRGFPHIRKAHCMYGWDWGPRLPDAGIFRPVYLWPVSTPKVRSVLIRQTHAPSMVQLNFTPDLDLPREAPAEGLYLRYTLLDPDGNELVSTTDSAMQVMSPRLWWPNGLGDQPLYTLKADLLSPEGVLLDRWEKRIGLRTVDIQETPDEYGTSFGLCVNGVPMFCMGADYIPEDNILRRVTPERTRRLLEDCRDAHFNCVRVWGGGYYPDDFFFDACDELGLLVWQDFMFACAGYELSPAFEENIRAEFRDNILRLRHHPSLALWCGNNENEAAMSQDWFGGTPQQKADYIKIFEYILPSLLHVLDPDRPYRPSSPSSGGAFDQPSDEKRGDVHYWGVWHGNEPFQAYRDHAFRFVSEFGFQSFPEMKTIESFTLPSDRNIFSYVMEKHQRNASANGKILNYLSQHYLYPRNLDTLVYASQLLQAEAVRCGVEHFRTHRDQCRGAIYWQINDCWPVASWASIDYYGRWKALQYMARRFYAPLLLAIEEDGLQTARPNVNDETPVSEIPLRADLRLSNESLQPRNVIVRWQLRTAEGGLLRQGEVPVSVPALSSMSACVLEFPEADPFEHFLWAELEENGSILSSTSSLFCPPKHFHFRDPQLTVTQEGDVLTISSRGYARMVDIQCHDADVLLSDNDFDMLEGTCRVTVLRGSGKRFSVRSVYDIH